MRYSKFKIARPAGLVALSAIALFVTMVEVYGAEISGTVSISYSDKTVEKPAHLHVFAVNKRELDKYLKPLLPHAEYEYTRLKNEWVALVMGYRGGLTGSQQAEYDRKKKNLFEGFDGILPKMLTDFPGQPITSTATNDRGEYRISIDGSFYILVLSVVHDNDTDVHHIWIVPDSEIKDGRLDLKQENEIPSVTILYRRYYPPGKDKN